MRCTIKRTFNQTNLDAKIKYVLSRYLTGWKDNLIVYIPTAVIMPPKIYNTKEPLNLDRLHLAKPTNKNGSHFIKTLDVDNPIYFLGPKCFSKNGFVKSGKKVFCDFVFSNEDSDFLAWLENLEETTKQIIYKNRETWFETPLDEHDIESSMSSPYKPYKSGKCFIVRANVPTALDKINIKVYDENEKETDPDNIKENTKVLAVFEFQGVRCNIRSFQFEIELKQLLIIEPEKLFEKCIIGNATSFATYSSSSSSETHTNNVQTESTAPLPVKDTPPPVLDLGHIQESHTEDEPLILTSESTDNMIPTKTDLDKVEDLHLNPEIITTEPCIEIFDANFPLEDMLDSHTDKEPPMRLKKRNDVYYKLYKEMRQRAKEAKREALANYLEAKRIKNAYLLEDVSDSESDKDDLEDM